MRRSEALNLKWVDIDFRTKTVRVTPLKGGKALSTFKKPSRNRGKEPQGSLEIQGYCEYTFTHLDIGKQPWNTIKQGIYFM